MSKTDRNSNGFLIILCLITLFIVSNFSFFFEGTTFIASLKPASAVMSENISSEASDYLNVKDFGMKGDGITNDGKAFKNVFLESQRLGVPLFFPTGVYNLGGVNLTADSPLIIIGDKKSTVKLIQPGRITCKSDVSIENITVIKDNTVPDVFLYLKPVDFISVYINNVDATSNHEYNGSAIFLYAYDNSGANGINNLNITNCNVSKFKSSFLLSTKIDCDSSKPGMIFNNTIEDLGDPTKMINATAIKLGFGNVKKADAHNVIISNNNIKNIYTAFNTHVDYSCGARGILVYGDHIIIQNNYIENIIGGISHDGIYAKAPNVQILNNTLINAGDGQGCIIHKSDVDSANNVIIKGNTIYYDLNTIKYATVTEDLRRRTSGILIQSDCFTIEDNNITIKNQGYAIHCGGAGRKIQEAIIKNNIININDASTGILAWQIVGNIEVTGNVVSAANSDNALYFRTMFSGSSITISSNKITTVSTIPLRFSNIEDNVNTEIK